MKSALTKVKAGDRSVYPHNHAFTDQERKVLQLVDQLRTTLGTLKTELARTPIHAHKPPANHDPEDTEEIQDIEAAIDSLDRTLRWLPGGVYRYAEGAAEAVAPKALARAVLRVGRSPMNVEWVLSLSCGHELRILAASKPTQKIVTCAACVLGAHQ